MTDTAVHLLERSSTFLTQADRSSPAFAAALPYRASRSSLTRMVNQRRSPPSSGGLPRGFLLGLVVMRPVLQSVLLEHLARVAKRLSHALGGYLLLVEVRELQHRAQGSYLFQRFLQVFGHGGLRFCTNNISVDKPPVKVFNVPTLNQEARMEMTRAAIQAHDQLRELVRQSISRTSCPAFQVSEPAPGKAEGAVDGVGVVTVLCRKELVERSRGMKIRRRFKFQLNGAKATAKSIYEKARAL